MFHILIANAVSIFEKIFWYYYFFFVCVINLKNTNSEMAFLLVCGQQSWNFSEQENFHLELPHG